MRTFLYLFMTTVLLLSGSADRTQPIPKGKAAASADGHPQELNYAEIFGDDYADALALADELQEAFDALQTDSEEKKFLTAIVFPELIRYSQFRDLMETEALELGYVRYGAEAVDFSIGQLQMKPSFVEQLEAYVRHAETLAKTHDAITVFSDSSAAGMRRERVARLGSLNWQARYLSCFYDVTAEKFRDVSRQHDAEALPFFATAYNRGFSASRQEIERWEAVCAFPYGTKYKGTQYAYADISLYFFNHHLKTTAP